MKKVLLMAAAAATLFSSCMNNSDNGYGELEPVIPGLQIYDYASVQNRIAMQPIDMALLEQTAGLYVSADNGEGWTREETPWLRDLREAWIAHMSMAPDGSVALVYSPPADETEETVEEGWNPEYLYVDPDGNPTALKSPDGSNTVHQFWFDKDSRLYAYTMSGKIFEMGPGRRCGPPDSGGGRAVGLCVLYRSVYDRHRFQRTSVL